MTKKKERQQWWADNPMTYGSIHGRTEYGQNGAFDWSSRAFFERLDQEFFKWNMPLHGERPFDHIFPYSRYRGAAVLEIGCGLGTMAMQWALSGAAITAIDFNATSISQTAKRFELWDLPGRIVQMDAQNLGFPNETFNYVYSWGVLHHIPGLDKSIAELMRVLKHRGEFGLMLYHRHSFLYWYMIKFLEGCLHLESRFLGPLELASRYTDGAREEGNPYTWPVTKREVRALLAPYSKEVNIVVLGTDLDQIFKLLLPGLGLVLPGWAKKPWARRFGWSLWISGRKD